MCALHRRICDQIDAAQLYTAAARVGQPWAMARRRSRPGKGHRHQALRVLGGTLLMLGSVAVALAILTQYAGAWGVPYFSFTTDRGSTCKNALAGYTCSAMTLADVEYIGNLDLPDD